jgi:mannose-1-phosphate guanylyltransferase/mannose-6-phosphate isomerase
MKKTDLKITPVILSGGSGTRLWPLSRESNPKQFLDFFGKNSLFQQTNLRTKNENYFNNPIIVCNEQHRFLVAESLQQIKISAKSIILEPQGRNTAPAIAIAAIEANDQIILVMPSDHIIENENEFIKSVLEASKLAQEGYLITFGIVPNSPQTGYGYIKIGKEINSNQNIFDVEKFVEKPEKKLAEEFIASKEYFWNSGIFMFKSSTYLEALQKVQPEVFSCCKKSYQNAVKDLDFLRIEKESFEKSPNISIDYGVMEKSNKIAIMPINVGWSDVGSWQAIDEISKKDENGNSLNGDVKVLKTKNCYINSQHKMVATIGLENLIIVALKDVVLVANKNNSQDVKQLFEILKKEQREECIHQTKVLRPWGSFESIDIDQRFKVKRITVKPKASLSLQMHNHRAEHWIVVKGIANVTCGEKEFILNEDQSTYIPLQEKHRLENKQDFDLEIIEVQTGKYLGEDDIIRFNDIYGR